ncbi:MULTISPECIES: single-stranded-DNA-specific exonuclease RecJ [unclassified Roseburia]|uniref:single-stranded-DNA-specific exonuclease RecJ n=1 Tax=unclassified Roseburia TaxID=2637578 RepID=UPI000E450B7F|nr:MULTISPECIES: single-stranded-DNA-specific exonuclease RecJ [unclassified Roseburia]RGF44851.1 single-stranded-DNA-specific exonuclease RecJ [Roseburia sp. AF42-8]RHQ41890.1 single-stranded-DNA-specific exonuclease RecJ [Roseburia sp. AF25-18LB]RHQ48353.1 single-stranded-DNA-specific exonuclease RecJ [Roseburia sp. AF25-15LB]RHQ48690.1 single-stranded-DNA-specific exonuclease RecJ [Roseburia sp. AF25-13LB]
MEKWIEIRKGGNFMEMAKKYGIDPLIARIIRNRDIIDEKEITEYLYGGKEALHNPHLLKDVDKAAEIIAEGIAGKKAMRIIGDYDIDGVNATYILLEGIRRCGGNVDAAIPDRMKDGYGINEHLIEQALSDGKELLITCDNGIAAINEINFAKEKGMTVVVTDHHEIPYCNTEQGKEFLWSNADAIVNPKQADCPYPCKGICGAVVAWKLVQVLYERMDIPVEEADIFIENAGFATVGDVMDLTGENRILVKLGLKALEHTKNSGMKALIAKNKLSDKTLSAYHIGFVLGPCINASGRLDTAKRSLELLLERDEVKASALAGELVELNESRKYMTQQETQKALEQIEKEGREKDKVLVVYLPECHESLAGIIAGRIREAYQRPVFVLTKGEEGVKGSGRSIEAYSMFDKMTEVAELFTKYGGHPMAAGLSMREEDIDKLREQLNQKAELSEEDMVEVVRLDAVLPMSYFTVDTIRQLRVLEPCGKSNTRPVFADRNIKITRAGIVGVNRNVLKLHLLDSRGNPVAGVYFGEVEKLLTFLSEKFGSEEVDAAMHGRENSIQFAAVYEPAVDTYSGRESVQAIIRRFR